MNRVIDTSHQEVACNQEFEFLEEFLLEEKRF